jgi:hypothetical protein
MFLAGRLLTRNEDALSAFISPALDAADLLALARLDDDGAPPAVSPPQSADGQRSHAIRVARTGQPAAGRKRPGRKAASRNRLANRRYAEGPRWAPARTSR